MGGDKRPAFQFYPGDYRTDIDLHLCSLAARGLWADMMCLMHDGEPYGHLRTSGGGTITAKELASLVGASAGEVAGCLAELKDREVFSIAADGTIYSRRMVLDAKDHAAFRERGSAGGRASAAKRWGSEYDDEGNPVVTTGVTKNVTKGVTKSNQVVTEKSNSPSPSPPPSPPPSPKKRALAGAGWGLNWIIDTWNDTADKCGLSKIRAMNDHRCRVATRRINEHGEAEMRRALEVPRRSRYLCGQLPDKPWKVTFDWLLKQENMLKVLEGNYLDSKLVVAAHMRVGESSDFMAWHPDDVARFSGEDDYHQRWDEYFDACADASGYDIEWPRFEKWIKDNPP